MTPHEALQILKERATHLHDVDYNEIVHILRQGVRRIPIPVAKIKKGTLIDRVRPNEGDKLFSCLDDLTYIKDPEVIEKKLTDFGRANCPHQPMFYGAVETTEIPQQRHTAIAETSALYQDKTGVCIEGQLYTVSRWRTTEELQLAEIVFSAGAITASPDIKRAFNNQLRFLAAQTGEDQTFLRNFLVFISEQFAREKYTHHDYKISAAYTNQVLHHPDISGIAYPSVQTLYKGENIVLLPGAVERSLVLESIATQRLHKNGSYMHINNHMDCTDPMRDPNNFKWVATDPIHIATSAEIQAVIFAPGS
jgi:hypothetical protein